MSKFRKICRLNRDIWDEYMYFRDVHGEAWIKSARLAVSTMWQWFRVGYIDHRGGFAVNVLDNR